MRCLLKLLLLAAISFLLTGCSDSVSVNYSDWQAVKDSGSIERGWIPDWLPQEAETIKERHNLDTNALAISFDVPTSDHELNGTTCATVTDAPSPLIELESFPASIHKMDGLRKCDGYFVYQSGTEFFLWKNAS